MRFLFFGLICLSAGIPFGYSAEAKVEAAPIKEVKEVDGFQQLRDELEKLLAERQYGKAAERCDAYLAQEGLDSNQKQAALSLKYFALMRAREFAKASDTAQALRNENSTTTLGKQAVGLKQRADAALAAVDEKPKRVKSVQSKKEEPAGKPRKEESKEVAKSTKPLKVKSKAASAHQKSLQALEASHQSLAKAEKAFAKAESDLAAAQVAHREAHKAEAAARQLEDKRVAQQKAKEAASKKSEVRSEKPSAKPAKKEEATSRIDDFEKRAAELRKKSEELSKKAEELRKAEEE